ncbi:MAG: hypothetical protein JWP82_2980, partial [Humibacillus sp.]|nr:hypothetical protein [Humibacillus sp.]
ALERRSVAVELETLCLDDDAEGRVGEVHLGAEGAVAEDVLRCTRKGSTFAPAMTSRGDRPARQAESATARASSRGRSRRQSMTVRAGLVTHPSHTSRGARSRQCRCTPVRAASRSLRPRGRVTWGRSGSCLTAQPQCRAAVVCDAIALAPSATVRAVVSPGSAYRPRATRTISPASRARLMRWRGTTRRRSRHEHAPPRCAKAVTASITSACREASSARPTRPQAPGPPPRRGARLGRPGCGPRGGPGDLRMTLERQRTVRPGGRRPGRPPRCRPPLRPRARRRGRRRPARRRAGRR